MQLLRVLGHVARTRHDCLHVGPHHHDVQEGEQDCADNRPGLMKLLLSNDRVRKVHVPNAEDDSDEVQVDKEDPDHEHCQLALAVFQAELAPYAQPCVFY